LIDIKKIKGIKAQLAEDEYCHILAVDIHKANIHDTKGWIKVMSDAFWKYPTIEIVVADKGYRGIFASYVNDILGKIIHIGQKIDRCYRYVVERTFAWLDNYTRLSKCFEHTSSSIKSFIFIAHSMTLLRRIKE